MNRLQKQAFAALSPSAQQMALRDRKFGREIDVGAAWLAEQEGITAERFLGRQRNARRPMVDGPDKLAAIDIADIVNSREGHSDDPLEILLAQERAAEIMASEVAQAELARIDALDDLAHVDVGAEARKEGLTRRAIQYRIAAKRRAIFDGQLDLALG
ncbi:hypothetical protein [Thiomonas sp. FB-Cd]|uniref:hypothetical protein n=1 Tax=Thiomonas sp. FB-Cd TaxID=1158292 RepID=UPI0004DF3545|nr:hypothetical protein [Thiomonas sp. FB-Cd]